MLAGPWANKVFLFSLEWLFRSGYAHRSDVLFVSHYRSEVSALPRSGFNSAYFPSFQYKGVNQWAAKHQNSKVPRVCLDTEKTTLVREIAPGRGG